MTPEKARARFDKHFDALIHLPEDDGVRQNLRDLVEHCTSLGLEPRWQGTKGGETNKFTVHIAERVLFAFTVTERPVVSIHVAKSGVLERTLAGISEEFTRLFLANMQQCTHCTPVHGEGAHMKLFGEKYSGLCNIGMMRVANPDREQMRIIKDYLTWKYAPPSHE